MDEVKRHEVGPRMSQMVACGNMVYTAGVVAVRAPGKSVGEQTADILAKIDDLLAAGGTDKSKILTATIWLSDISSFAEMNRVWDSWVVPGRTPCRACVEAKLAGSEYTVEIQVTAVR
ncbi:RidA family protein [Microvirga zambiensis]|uniref:RidA family protein n=1 Tax=Microvirga zambiensis TaxID=1402137 RepID=UPI00191EB9CD|nr:RidA family protein [Microvirga zambiensis]